MEEQKDRKLQLHYWYVEEIPKGDTQYRVAHGVVSGHKRLMDSVYIHTSEIKDIVIDKKAGEAIITTRNSEYHCALEYCDWAEQDKRPDILPEYEWIKNNYKDKITYPSIEEGKVLLVLSNFDDYYFNSIYYKPEGADEKITFSSYPNIGMFQDSFLIYGTDTPIDIRYFPHYQNIEFYSEHTANLPFFVENIGDNTLYVKSSQGLIRLEPGERKEISKENAEKEEPFLPEGDLYPAGIIDD